MIMSGTKINNRRYLGNKYKLLSFIKSITESECENINSIADIFAGTGAVASAFIDKQIITNDILYSNYISHFAFFAPIEYSEIKIREIIKFYNFIGIYEDNYMSENFANTFFSLEDCRKIGFIREDIEKRFENGELNEREKALLITSLLYGVDKIANTCGHYDAFMQNAVFEKHLELAIPITEQNLNKKNMCFNEDANELVKSINADLVYIDPPYNSRQYCDAYHLLENIARWEKPKVMGIARKMNRNFLKSDYCTQNATSAFYNLIESINAKYILFSYNNMAKKGNERSNAKINDNDIIRILSKKGKVKVFSREYKAFSTGKSEIEANEERLFLCICDKKEKLDFIQSPLNYTGGKYKLLKQMVSYFPRNCDVFVDLFCGGGNVGINFSADKVVLNDINDKLLFLYNTFKNLGKKEIFETINLIILKYGLSQSVENGYKFYNCNSSKGLGEYNKDKYLKLRNDFNFNVNEDYYYYIMFFVLMIYSFNNQIRFNSKGKFNLPVGKRDFNKKMQQKLFKFIDKIKQENITVSCVDFRNFNTNSLSKDSFVYVDPPYLIACATYNEQNGWTEKDEIDLLKFLDELNEKKIKFALSNILTSKGRRNEILQKWLECRNYRIINLEYNYSNSNYQKIDKDSADEILVVNYWEENNE